MFVKNDDIKDFFINKIDKMLDNYEYGSINNKPNTIKQLELANDNYKEIISKPLCLLNPDNSTKILNNIEILEIINSQQSHINDLNNKLNNSETNKLMIKNKSTNKDIILSNEEILNIINNQENIINKLKEDNSKLLYNNNILLEQILFLNKQYFNNDFINNYKFNSMNKD